MNPEDPIVAHTPPALVYIDSRLDKLTERVRSRPVSSLRLGKRAAGALGKAGVDSVGQMIDLVRRGLPGHPHFGPAGAADLCSKLEQLARKSPAKRREIEARYSISEDFVFFFRATKLQKLSQRSLKKGVEALSLGPVALKFARTRCYAFSLEALFGRCSSGVRIVNTDDARAVVGICVALETVAASASADGKIDWRKYRRLHAQKIAAIAAENKKLNKHLVGANAAAPASRELVSVLRSQCGSGIQFDFPEFPALSDEAANTPLASLLSRRACNIYCALGASTLGLFVELARKGFSRPAGFGQKCLIETIELLEILASLVDKNGDLEIKNLFKKMGQPVPSTLITPADTGDYNYIITFPNLCYTSKNLERMSESARRQLIHNLHLDSRAATTVEALGLIDVGAFVDKLKTGINANKLRNFGRGAFNELADIVVALSSSIDSEGECDWVAYASARGLKLLPSGKIETSQQVVEQMPVIMEQAVEAQFKGKKDFVRQMDVFKGRLHSPIDDHLTLDQLAFRYRRSRERIRQIQMETAGYLSAPLLQGCYSVPVMRRQGKSYEALRFRFHPAVEKAVQSAAAALEADGRKVWRLDDWVQFLSQLWKADPCLVERNTKLLSVLFRFSLEAQTFDGETKGFLLVSEDVSTPVKQDFRDLLKDVQLSMQGALEPLTAAEVLEPFEFGVVLRELAVSPDRLLSFCPVLSSDDQGLWKVKPEFFKPQTAKLTRDAVYEILRSQGTRMHKADIIRIFKAKYPDLFGNERLFVARIASDERFDALSKSGFWVLSEWNKETGTIREVLNRVLKASNGPMNISDILLSVRDIVPCAESSIRHHLLHSGGKYIRLSKTVFDLASRHAGGDA